MQHLDLDDFLDEVQKLFEDKITQVLMKQNAVKVNTMLESEYSIIKNSEEVMELRTFYTKNAPILQTTDLRKFYIDNVKEPLGRKVEDFQERESGWSLRQIVRMSININKYNPMRGSSFIELPEPIQNKHACVNVKNFDDECFRWAILSALHPVARRHFDRVSKYESFKDELNFTDISFPVMSRDVSKFEKQNTVSINVYILEKKKKNFIVAPVHITAHKKDRHVNLLLIQNYYIDEDNDGDCEPLRFHYVWIKDLSRLVSTQLSKRDHKTYICDKCLHYFRTVEKLTVHDIDCSNINTCRVNLPTSDNCILKFNNHKNNIRVPYVVYADFECILRKIDASSTANTQVVQVHEACSVGFYVKCSYDEQQSRYASYRGQDPAQWFSNELLALTRQVEGRTPQAMTPLTPAEKETFRTTTNCHICKKSLKGQVRVRDHCHLTGKFRGAAHQRCNLEYQDTLTIPVIFHNLSGYDSHLIIKQISNCVEGRIVLLPQTMERYISFTKHINGCKISLRFIDSFKFMTSSLDKLASYLEEKDIVCREFADSVNVHLLMKKGVFPYEYLDSWEKFNETELPPKTAFHSSLTDSDISDNDYCHAQAVWQSFNIQNLGEYSDLYLKTDVLLLADVFENFRKNSLQAYSLDPAHYYTTPGLSWDAMLKYTNIELELLTDIDKLLFVERGIRGGISQCSHRYARANNPYYDYNPKEDKKYLMYYDVNNLYGWAMTQYLPYGGFEWVENCEWDVSDDSEEGYILEVDLEYPESLHDAHNDLPFCAEHKNPTGSKQKKLLTNLESKKRYVIHYRNLRQALRHGLILTKIHRILKFKQSAWLKSYIDLNSELRKTAKNEFEKNLYKLMNNAVYGKTMENVRKRVDVKLVTKWLGRYGAEALIAKPNFSSRSIFDENLVAIKLTRVEVTMNKPIYIGFCVLDLSKTCLYSFHYEFMKPTTNAKILYTDTDSLIYEIKNLDPYKMMQENANHFDTSDYPSPNRYGLELRNKKVVGLMKDECNGKIITEFVGLRSKMYSLRVEGQDRIKKAKGVKGSVVEKTIDFDDYVNCLYNEIIEYRIQYLFRSRLHEIHTIKQTKCALNPRDDKRYILPDTTNTLAHGHYRIREFEDSMDVE